MACMMLFKKCNHEEADTRIVVHVLHALRNRAKTVVDTDVVVILVGMFKQLKEVEENLQIWVAFGMGKAFSHISINDVCTELGDQRSLCVPLFHALSGCDTTSSFYGKGKKSTWLAWEASHEFVTQSLVYLSQNPFHSIKVDSLHFQNIERMVIILYDKMSQHKSVNLSRKEIFCKQSKTIEKLPPTQVC